MDEHHESTSPAGAEPPEPPVAAARPGRLAGSPLAGLLLRPLARPDVLVPLAITVASLAIHLARLGNPHGEIPLDERHYIPDSRDVLRFGTESDVRVPSGDGAFVVHPPLAKMFIAAGMKIFGTADPVGWRFFGAVFGALGSLVIYLIARRLWGSRRTAALAGVLLTVEGLWFVQSRVAMLDIYVSFFLLVALWLLLEDRARPSAGGIRWWRVGSGVAAGLALASKWGAVPTLGVLTVLALVWEIGPALGPRLRRLWAAMGPQEERSGGGGTPLPGEPTEAGAEAGPSFAGAPARPLRRAAAVLGTFVALPAVIYVATYTPWLLDSKRYLPPRCVGKGPVSGWVCYQREIYDFHKNLEKFDKDVKPKHPYFSEVWTWPWIGRPVVHYYETRGTGALQRDSEIVGLPNPVIWWAGFLAVVPLSVRALRRRAGRDPVARLLAALFAANYLAYLVPGFFGRPAFLFYATPIVPVLVLAVVHVLRSLGERGGRWRIVAPAYTVLAVLAFVYFYPVLAASWIPHGGASGWQGHMWFGDALRGDCVAAGIKKLCWI
ncbi:MAG: phospholipid carrier-dependent glycosyltransferase [Acidobacteria bacterium]|nr:phospholipid carrier-dependent glycosyltransferase [Acidobacteriota bacterium]